MRFYYRKESRLTTLTFISRLALTSIALFSAFQGCQPPPDWIQNTPPLFNEPSPQTSEPSNENKSPEPNQNELTSEVDPLDESISDPHPLPTPVLPPDIFKIKSLALERPPEHSPITDNHWSGKPKEDNNSELLFTTPSNVSFLDSIHNAGQAPLPDQSASYSQSSSQYSASSHSSLRYSSYASSQGFSSSSVGFILKSAENAYRELAQRQASLSSAHTSSESSYLSSSLAHHTASFSQSTPPRSTHQQSSSSSSLPHATQRPLYTSSHNHSKSSACSSPAESSASSSQNSSQQAISFFTPRPSIIPPSPSSPYDIIADEYDIYPQRAHQSTSSSFSPFTDSTTSSSTTYILIPHSFYKPELLSDRCTKPNCEILTYTTDHEALHKLISIRPALTILPDTILAYAISSQLLRPIPIANRATIEKIPPLFTGHYFDPKNEYTIPYAFTHVLLAQRSQSPLRPIKDWPELITYLNGDNPNLKKQANGSTSPPPHHPDSNEISPSPSPNSPQTPAPPPPPFSIALPANHSLHPAIWAKIQNRPQRKAPTPPQWWPKSTAPTSDATQNTDLIIDESHHLILSLSKDNWLITFPSSGTITRLYHLALPNSSTSDEDQSQLLSSWLEPDFHLKFTQQLALGCPLNNAQTKAPPLHPLVYPSSQLLSLSRFALPMRPDDRSPTAPLSSPCPP
ncbi:MAG: hypothetical protein NZM04_03015 [Methylacidiphilales bacterium]|nr:hypothetical protein [Candidatus Methylacidiphilales bacterium]MDW8348704.1 hypothetical protein [Verrucomicrobiae bacterium]